MAKKKEFKKVPAYIMRLLDQLEQMFDVTGFERHVVIAKNDKEDTACDIALQSDYNRLRITIYPCFFEATRIEQRCYLLHEFVHTVLHPLVTLLRGFEKGQHSTPQQAVFENERATSRITQLLDALLDGQYQSKRKAYARYIDPKKR